MGTDADQKLVRFVIKTIHLAITNADYDITRSTDAQL